MTLFFDLWKTCINISGNIFDQPNRTYRSCESSFSGFIFIRNHDSRVWKIALVSNAIL